MKSIYPILLSLTLLLVSAKTVADAAAIEQLEKNVSSLEQQIKENTQDIQSYQVKLEKASSELDEASDKLTEADFSYKLANANHDKEASSENARALRNANNTRKLLEKKVSAKQKRVDWLNNEISYLRSSSTSAKKEINQANEEIASVKSSWNEKIRRQQLADNKKERRKKVALATNPPKKPDVPKAPKKNLSDKEKIDAINTYLSNGVSPNSSINFRVGFSDKSGRIEFKHLGGEIYRGEANLKKNKQVINYAGSSFKIDIASTNDKAPHLIYFDNRDKNNRELIVLKK